MAESLSLSREEIPQPFFACRTFADLAAIPEDATVPVVIYGDGNIGSLSPIGTVSFIRESHKLNPVIYYDPSQDLGLQERVRFFDAGGDALILKSDIGNITQDPEKDFVLSKRINSLYKIVRRNLESRQTTTYDFGFLVDTHKKIISIDGKPIPLTGFQYRILQIFLELRQVSKSKSVSRVSLYIDIYDVHGENQLNMDFRLLSSHLSHINNKLKPHNLHISGITRGMDKEHFYTLTKI